MKQLAIAVLVGALTACTTEPPHTNPFDPVSPPALQAKAAIHGTVTLEAPRGADALAGTDVSLVGTGLVARTDAAGRFRLEGVAPGSYTLQASRPGYESATSASMVVIRLEDLAAGTSEFEAPTMRLRVARGRVTGKVALEGEASFAGVAASLSAIAGAEQTGPDGAFAFDSVPVGVYSLKLEKPAFASLTLSDVKVEANADTELAAVTLAAEPGSISGRVLARGSADPSRTKVWAEGLTLGGTPHTAPVTLSDAEGRFTLSAVPAGTYSVHFDRSGYLDQPTPATVLPKTDRQLPDVRLERIVGSARGVATLQGAADASGIAVTFVSQSPEDPPPPVVATTDATGAWSAETVPAGSWTVTFSRRPGFKPRSLPVRIDAAETTAVPAVALEINPGVVEGTVTLEGRADASAAKVEIDAAQAVAVAANGAYRATVSHGLHTLSLSAPGFAARDLVVLANEEATVRAPAVELQRERGAIVGTVDLVGAPNDGGVLVQAESGGIVEGAAVSDASGAFALRRLPTGTYVLTASREGFLSRRVVDLVVVANGEADAGIVVLERMLGDFSFLHCQHYQAQDKRPVSLVGNDYLAECGSATGCRARLELNPPSGTTKIEWSLAADLTGSHTVDWDPASPPEIDVGAASGTRTVYLRYLVPANTPPWSAIFSASLKVDRENPVVDPYDPRVPTTLVAVLNEPPYLTPSRLIAYLGLRAHDPASGTETGSGIAGYALLPGGQPCPPAGSTLYRPLPSAPEQGVELNLQRIQDPALEPEGAKAIAVCVRDAAGNLAAPPSPAPSLDFDKTAPQALSFHFYADETATTPLALTRHRDVVLKARVSASLAPLTGVAWASHDFECATASYETPDPQDPATPAGTSPAEWALVKPWQLGGADGAKRAYLCLRDRAGNTTANALETTAEVALDTLAPQQCSVSLAATAASRQVAVTFASSDPAGQLFVGGDVESATGTFPVKAWVPFRTNSGAGALPLLVSDGDGLKVVSVRCADAAGNETAPALATLVLDRTAPTGTVRVAGNGWTQVPGVTLELAAAGATRMCLYGDLTSPCDPTSPTSTWESYQPQRAVTLVASQQSRTVRVRYGDEAGNTSAEASDSVVYDSLPPAPDATTPIALTGWRKDSVSGVDVADPQLSWRSEVRVTLKATGATRVALSNTPLSCNTASYSVAEFVSGSLVVDPFLLQGGTGTRTVYACLGDDAGNVTSSPLSASLYLDQSEPDGVYFSIAGGVDYATTSPVTLTQIGASDDWAGSIYVRFANLLSTGAPGTWSAWEKIPATGTKSWALTAGDGAKTVLMQARDYAGNATSPLRASIALDSTNPEAPGVPSVGPVSPGATAGYVAVRTPSISWTPSTASDASHYEISISGVGTFASPTPSLLAPAMPDGAYTVQVRAIDVAGRASGWAGPSSLVIDTVPPTSPRLEAPASLRVNLAASATCADDERLTLARAAASSDANLDRYEIRGGHAGTGTGACIPLNDFASAGLATAFDFRLIRDRANTLQLRAVDKAGNASDPDVVVVTEDSTAPGLVQGFRLDPAQSEVIVTWTPPADTASAMDTDVAGFKLLYGSVGGTDPALYTGGFADQGPSPIDVGLPCSATLPRTCQFKVTGVPNGSPVYFSMQAYDRTDPPNVGAALPGAVTYSNELGPSLLATLSMPTAPGGAATCARGVQVRGDRAYVTFGNGTSSAAGTGGGLAVVDLGDPAHPTLVDSTSLSAMPYAWNLRVRDRYAYVVDQSNGLKTIELTYPGTATSGGTYSLTDSRAAWTANRYVGRRVRITGGPGAGQVRTISSNSATALNVSLAWSPAPGAGSRYEILSLSVVDTRTTGSRYKSLEIQGEYLYVAAYDDAYGSTGRVDIYSLRSGTCGSAGLARPGYCGTLVPTDDCAATAKAPREIALQGKRMYLTLNSTAAAVSYDLTNPVAPAGCQTIPLPSSLSLSTGVAVSGRRLFVGYQDAYENNGFSIHDVASVSTGYTPQIGLAESLSYVRWLAVEGGYALLTSGGYGPTSEYRLVAYDLSRFAAPRRVGEYRAATGNQGFESDAHSGRLAVLGNHVLVARCGGLDVLQLSKPTNLQRLGEYTGIQASGAGGDARTFAAGALTGNLAIGPNANSLVGVEITNPAAPSLFAQAAILPGSDTSSIEAEAGFVYVGSWDKSGTAGTSSILQVLPTETGFSVVGRVDLPTTSGSYQRAQRLAPQWPYLFALLDVWGTYAPSSQKLKVYDVRTNPFTEVFSQDLNVNSTHGMAQSSVSLAGPYAYVGDCSPGLMGGGVDLFRLDAIGTAPYVRGTYVKNLPDTLPGLDAFACVRSAKVWGDKLFLAGTGAANAAPTAAVLGLADLENPSLLYLPTLTAAQPFDVFPLGPYAFFTGQAPPTLTAMETATGHLVGSGGDASNGGAFALRLNRAFVFSNESMAILRIR